MAVVAEGHAEILPFCPGLDRKEAARRRYLRKLDRQRRANNPENYREDGTLRPRGQRRPWRSSGRQEATRESLQELLRAMAAQRKGLQGELAHQVLALGNEVVTEKVNKRAWAKLWGRSVGHKAPGMFETRLGILADASGGSLEQVPRGESSLVDCEVGAAQSLRDCVPPSGLDLIGWEVQMGILQGGVSLKRFLVLGAVPDDSDVMAGLSQDQFRPFQDGLETERAGWCDWRNLLITPPDENWVFQERFAIFGLRIDTRKVPTALLKAHVDLRCQNLIIGKKARLSIQDEVSVELLRKVLPTPKVVEVAWERKAGILWTTASGNKAQGALQSLFMKSFGCELHALVPLPLAGKVAPDVPTEDLMGSDPMNFELEGA